MHTAVQVDGREIHTSGYNGNGQLGRPTGNRNRHCSDEHFNLPRTFSPVFCSSVEEIVQIVCTFYATFVLTNVGRIYGWGTFRDTHGRKAFADGVESCCDSRVIYNARPNNPVVKVAAGANHIVAVLKVDCDQTSTRGTMLCCFVERFGSLVGVRGSRPTWPTA